MATYTPSIVTVSVTTVTGTYKDLNDFGFMVARIPRGVFDGPTVTFPTAPRPGEMETEVLNTNATGEPRELVVEGTVEADTMANLLTNLRNLTGWCRRAVAVKTIHDANTFLQVSEVSVSTEHPDPQALTPGCGVALTFRAFDPHWYATTQETPTFTTNTQMALGTARSKPVLRLTGIHTNPTITYKNAVGTTIATMVLTITIAGASDYVEIDMARRTIVKSISSVITDAIDTLTSGSFFALDPADADTVTPTWGSLSVSYGSGSSTAVATYRKAYY